MKVLQKSFQRPIFIFLFFSFISAALLAPMASDVYMPNLADFINHLALIIQAKTALSDGQFPLRLIPQWNSYPIYQFYSPTAYTLAALIYKWLTPSNPLIAYRITMWCGLVIGGIYMYRSAFWLTRSRFAAILAGVVYLYAPYSIIIVNHTGDLTETLAFGLLPAVLFYTFQRYYHPDSNKNLLQMGLVWYLLITIHIVTFVYLSFFTAILLIIPTLTNHRWKNLIRVGIAYIFACLLAMWFLGPVGLLQKYLILNMTYDASSGLNKLHPLFSYLLSPGASTPGEEHSVLFIHPSIGWPILLAVGLSIYALFNKFKSASKRADYWLLALVIVFLIAFIMVWSPVNLWRWLPEPLRVGQYTWRLLAQVSWIGALLFAWAVCWLFKNKLDFQHVVIGILLIVVSTNVWFPTIKDFSMDMDNFIKHPYLVYNENAYLLDINKYPNLVDRVDNVTINSGNFLKLNTPFKIPVSLINLAVTPIVSLQGEIPKQVGNSKLLLTAKLNGTIIAKRIFSKGLFTWQIPIPSGIVSLMNQKKQKVNFEIVNTQQPFSTLQIPIKHFMLTGFVKASEIMDMTQMQPYCQQQNTAMLCNVDVPGAVKLLELPILYYPKLLNITVNGNPAIYNSVLYHEYLMTSITPDSGKSNTIKVEFKGLPWANWTSWGAWSIWLLLLLGVLKQTFTKKSINHF